MNMQVENSTSAFDVAATIASLRASAASINGTKEAHKVHGEDNGTTDKVGRAMVAAFNAGKVEEVKAGIKDDLNYSAIKGTVSHALTLCEFLKGSGFALSKMMVIDGQPVDYLDKFNLPALATYQPGDVKLSGVCKEMRDVRNKARDFAAAQAMEEAAAWEAYFGANKVALIAAKTTDQHTFRAMNDKTTYDVAMMEGAAIVAKVAEEHERNNVAVTLTGHVSAVIDGLPSLPEGDVERLYEALTAHLAAATAPVNMQVAASA